MIARIKITGELEIVPQNETEAYALRAWCVVRPSELKGDEKGLKVRATSNDVDVQDSEFGNLPGLVLL